MACKIRLVNKAPSGAGKKMWVGGAIAGVTGIATTLMGNKRQKDAEKEMRRLQFKNTVEQRKTSDRNVLDTYPTEGLDIDQLYAKGGQIRDEHEIPNNNSLGLATNAEKVVNAGTHESGNDVNVFDNAGQVAAKVEDQEVIVDGNKVLSERLGYADVAENISGAKGEIENVLSDKNLKSLDNRERNTLDRTLSPLKRALGKLDQANDANFNAQEANKGEVGTIESTGEPTTQVDEQGIPIAQEGIDLEKLGKEAVPFIDNIAGFLRRTPKPVAPVMVDPAQIDTTVDVSQQLQDVEDVELATIDDIEAGTASSNVAQARKAAARQQSRKAKGQILEQKEGREQQLENVQQQQTQAAEARNIAAQEDYQSSMLSRDVARGEQLAANISNIVGDIRQSELDKAAAEKDERAVMAITAQSAGSGADYQLALSGALDFLSDDNKQIKIQQYEAAGRDASALKQKWGLAN